MRLLLFLEVMGPQIDNGLLSYVVGALLFQDKGTQPPQFHYLEGNMFIETNIKHSFCLRILSILFILTLFGLKPVLADTPPYSNTQTAHLASNSTISAAHLEYPTTKGLGYAFSDSSIDSQAGVIHHVGVTGAHFAGAADIVLLDAIKKRFSVSQSGIYLVTFTGRISGGLWNISSTLLPGAAKGATNLRLFCSVLQSEPPYLVLEAVILDHTYGDIRHASVLYHKFCFDLRQFIIS